MSDLSSTSRLVASDLRKAEKSIEIAQRDLLQFMLTTTEANMGLSYAPIMVQAIMPPSIAALASLSASQQSLSGDAHSAALKLARRFQLTETSYGAGDPKSPPKFGALADAETIPA